MTETKNKIVKSIGLNGETMQKTRVKPDQTRQKPSLKKQNKTTQE